MHEVHVLAKLDSEHIIKYFDCFIEGVRLTAPISVMLTCARHCLSQYQHVADAVTPSPSLSCPGQVVSQYPGLSEQWSVRTCLQGRMYIVTACLSNGHRAITARKGV